MRIQSARSFWVSGMKLGVPVVPLVEKMRTTSVIGTARWVPMGSASVREARSSSFSVNGRLAMASSPPTAVAAAKPAAFSLSR